MFISPAFAQSLGDTAGGMMQIAPLILIFVVFYFLLIRPQQTKAKQLRTMVEGLRRGDKVVTAGGIIGTVQKVDGNEELVVEIAEGVRVHVVRTTISQVLSKPVPAAASKKAKDDEPDKKPATPEAANASPGDWIKSGLRRLIGG